MSTTTTTAFVLSGGGSLGSIQVGMLQALASWGVEPDLLVGTSAGAMNALWVAGHGMSPTSLRSLAAVWVGLRRTDVFPVDSRRVFRALLSREAAVSSSASLARLVRRHATFDDLSEAPIPVHFVAADLLSGRDVLISDGPAVPGVMASAAIPGVYAPVERDGHHLVDGALAQHAGVTQAVSLGAKEVYLLPTGMPCALTRPPRSAVGIALHSLSLLLEQRLVHDVIEVEGSATIRVLPPLCPLAVSAADFGHAGELIDRARRASLEWLRHGRTDLASPERYLSLHHHRDSTLQPGMPLITDVGADRRPVP